MKNSISKNTSSSAEFLLQQYSTTLITRFDLENVLNKTLNLSIFEAIKRFGLIPRRVFGIGRNRKCQFSIVEVNLYIQDALLQLEEEEIDFDSIIDTIIADNPYRYTLFDTTMRKYLLEDMNSLPNDYTIEELEVYVFDNLKTDIRILAEQYNLSEGEVEYTIAVCNEYDLDFTDALKKAK